MLLGLPFRAPVLPPICCAPILPRIPCIPPCPRQPWRCRWYSLPTWFRYSGSTTATAVAFTAVAATAVAATPVAATPVAATAVGLRRSHNLFIVAFRRAPVCARPVGFAFAFLWRPGQLKGRLRSIDLRNLNFLVRVIGVKPDRGPICASNKKIPYKDFGVSSVGTANVPRSMPSFVVITSRYRLASNADDA